MVTAREQIDWPVSYDVEDMTEVPLWIHAVQFARTDQAVQQRSVLTVVGAEEQEVLATQTDRPQGIFRDVVICFSLATLCIVRQCRPLVQGVRERLLQL